MYHTSTVVRNPFLFLVEIEFRMNFYKSHAVALQTEADMNPTTIRGGILLFFIRSNNSGLRTNIARQNTVRVFV